MSNEIAVPQKDNSWEAFVEMLDNRHHEGIEEGRERALLAVARRFMSANEAHQIQALKVQSERIERLERAIAERLSK